VYDSSAEIIAVGLRILNSTSGNLLLVRGNTLEPLCTIRDSSASTVAVKFSKDSKLLAAVYNSGDLHIYIVTNSYLLALAHSIKANMGELYYLHFFNDHLICCGYETVRVDLINGYHEFVALSINNSPAIQEPEEIRCYNPSVAGYNSSACSVQSHVKPAEISSNTLPEYQDYELLEYAHCGIIACIGYCSEYVVSIGGIDNCMLTWKLP
jgi:hypothetical protein